MVIKKCFNIITLVQKGSVHNKFDQYFARITSAGELGERCKFASFKLNSIFIDKKAYIVNSIDLN